MTIQIYCIIITVLLLCNQSSTFAQFTNPLPIPDTLSGPVINLSLTSGQKAILPGNPTPTLSYNNFGYLGPTLILRKGWEVTVTIHNQIDDTTTLHWHGLHVSSHTDGGPHSPILPGGQWNPHFTCMDKAGTYWYHPHFHKKTAEQTLRGAAGLILVRDAEEANLNLPRTYGKDDFPIILQSLEFKTTNEILPKGQQDSIVLINGAISPYLAVPAQWTRFRLLNASNTRNFYVGFEDNRIFKMIGSDGGLLGRPISVNRIKIAPGERFEILVDFTGLESQILKLKSFGSEIPSGVQGGPTIFSPHGTPSMASPLNGVNYDLLDFRVKAALPNPITNVPDSLAVQKRLQESDAALNRFVVFSSAVPGSSHGPFLLNDSSFNMERIDFTIPVNQTEIWTIHNQTVVAHPFHIHGFQFYILDRYGSPVGPEEMGRKDMVMVGVNESLRIITKFSDFADSIMPYMFHCHILTHEDEGMMGQFVVAPLTSSLIQKGTDSFKVWPNPLRDVLNISGSTHNTEIFNFLGKKIGELKIGVNSIETSHWPQGLYRIKSGHQMITLLKW